MDIKDADPKGLIRECYLIEGITASECRSVFVDWALSLPAGADFTVAVRSLIERYAAPEPDHPMSPVLTEGLQIPDHPKRRGGRAARVSPGLTSA